MINGPSALTTARERALGFERAMRDANLPIPGKHGAKHRVQPFSRICRNAEASPFLGTSNRGIYCKQLLTLGALQAIHELHRAIPKEIAIVGFDEMPWAMSLRPPLTTIAQPSFEVGRTAANLLLERLRDPALPLPARSPRDQVDRAVILRIRRDRNLLAIGSPESLLTFSSQVARFPHG